MEVALSEFVWHMNFVLLNNVVIRNVVLRFEVKVGIMIRGKFGSESIVAVEEKRTFSLPAGAVC